MLAMRRRGETAMATVNQYRQYAKECVRWAAEAETEENRKALLELARDWTLAAMRLEGVLSTTNKKIDASLQRTA
jgi:hypothetical protein